MADRQRELPPWMGRIHKGDCITKKVTAKVKAKLIPRVTVYLMNESELVQSAVVLGNLEDRRIPGCTKKVLKTEHVEERREGLDQGSLDLPRVRCVSESYLDTTELETLPYNNDQGLQSDNGNCVSSTLAETPGIVSEDDDSLKLVREIFFK